MDRKTFMRELEYLLQDISEEERKDALSFYENYFDEAGKENEEHVIEELGDPSRVALIIKDGLKGHFDDHINVGNSGFSDDNYKYNYEVIDVDTKQEEHSGQSTRSHFKGKWQGMHSHDRTLLIVIALCALIPFSFSTLGIFGGIFGGVLELD